ncbi:bifunctional UDP-N-acetylglucosamine diphosphorylase/glucosamine-1-phosphate N-acetyltransferase GlmU [uncultured Sneathia sp.]|uniref:bifunctional UDP-N-acetylglucosamine diphosphorylase/glucosamine-1-phosphate N-acetyltransferase GlmU n=1 Tax=uncultured Sneathia sp. TaxID=278067 RepID=UPI002595A6EC|nr:bifunctional UDP-N-acetylglucosamine diphosphorylase/glucosamine-1-phosphate N-acetyltransferase GlmU [uncultured Sneathia sp.]
MLSIILAAGKGTRMKSSIPKVLHKVNGEKMLQKVINTTKDFGDVLLILGYKKEEIIKDFPEYDYVVQEEQLGTGHAIKIAKDKFKNSDLVLVTYGDGPLLSKYTIEKMKDKFIKNNLDCLLLTCKLDDPMGYGRIIKNDMGKVIDIIEEKEASEDIKKINEINVGVYLFKTKALLDVIDKIDNKNSKGEYYLTDAIKILNNLGYTSDSLLLKDKNEMIGVNSKKDLALVSKILTLKKLDQLMEDGVNIIDPNNTYIEEDVVIGCDTTIYPNTIIKGKTIIGQNCTIFSSRIEDSTIKDNVKIDNSVIESSILEDEVTIGPFAHLRKGTVLNKKVHIGNFVEVKNSTLNEGVKSGHLTYLGDSVIGANTNIGAGTITCNYDGVNKNKTFIGKDAFIGSNSIFVAPVKVGDNVLTAAGSVITKNVDDNKIAFGRARQVIINKK